MRPSSWDATLARTCMLLWLALAVRAVMTRVSEHTRHISVRVRSASDVRKFSRPAFEISPAFFSRHGTSSSSSLSMVLPRPWNISCTSSSTFFTVRLRSWSMEGEAARTSSCSEAFSTSG
ncbi:hypothetical protein V8C86DRAFT_2516252 [Haematococcus lacustris]